MRNPPLLIALFIALLRKQFAQDGSGDFARQLLSDFLGFGTLVYAFRDVRSLALCLSVLGVATVANCIFWPNSVVFRPLEVLSQGLSFFQ